MFWLVLRSSVVGGQLNGISNMKVTKLLAALLLAAAPALAQEEESVSAGDVEFTASLTGSGNSGFDIYAKSSAAINKSCTATVTVTKSDGSTQSWTYKDRNVQGGTNAKQWFGGESSVSGSPLSDPMISDQSCS